LLGTKFDSTRGESFFEDKMPAVIEELRQKDLLKKSEGAELVFFPQDKLPPLMVIKSDGSTLYATRDLATDKYRLATYGPEIIIVNEVGSEQSLYFRQLFELEKMLGWFQTGQRIHIAHGLIRGKEGKLSTRKGDAIWLEEVLTEAVKRAGAFNPDTAEAVGIGALKYNDLKRESQKDIIFDWNDILNLEGNSGPYLQYTYARAKSLLVKAGVDQATWSAPVEVGQLERLLYRFPEVVEHSAQDYAPHHLCTYLYELAATFNNFYNQVKIIGAPDEAYRLALTTATAQILGTGLDLLGISAPERM
ncbi:MAG: arginine--tRNA ligase, partial [Patescibacteria group bacterium]